MHRRQLDVGFATTLGVMISWLAWSLGVPAPGWARPAPQPAGDAADEARRALVVAHFDDATITVGELEDAIQAQNPFMQERYATPEAVHAVLERTLRFELLAAEARRRGYADKPPVVLAVNQNAVQTLIKRDIDDQITTKSIPAEDVKQYFDAHRDEFSRPETRRASVVLLASEDAAKQLLPEAKAADLRAFRELARAKSVDETNRQRGGDLRYFDANGQVIDAQGDALDPAIAKAAFTLKQVGDTSGVVPVGDKFAIVRLTGLRAAESDTPAQADERIRMRLWRERRQAAVDHKLFELRARLKPEVHPELVDLVKLETAPATPPPEGLPTGFPHTRPGPVMSPPAK